VTDEFAVNLRSDSTSGYDGYSFYFGALGYGYGTDSTSVRIDRLEFAG
jgi:hypothetical protein